MRRYVALAWAVGRVSREVAAFLSILSFAIESAAHHVCSRGGLREAHLPTEQSSPRQEARLPPPDEHPRRASRAEGTSRQGPAPPLGLIWRIRERSAFTRLARRGPANPGRSPVVHVHSRSRCNATAGGLCTRSRHRTSRDVAIVCGGDCGPLLAVIDAAAGPLSDRRPPVAAQRSSQRTGVRSAVASWPRVAGLIAPGHSGINAPSRVARRRAGSPRPVPRTRSRPSPSTARGRGLWLTLRRFAPLPTVRPVRVRPTCPTGKR